MKPIFIKIPLLLGCLLFMLPLQAQKNKIITLKPAQFKAQMEQTANPCVIDVRSSKVDFEAGHIVGAVQLNPDDLFFVSELKRLQPDTAAPVFVYCRMGKTSKMAAQKLASNGFTNVYSLKGGILAWEKLFPTVTE